ncbi:hypothetical protein LTR78_000148 [Recurvomyces mirabilis]|uniref:PH domain-containing protein n=1 Tax=Recurvomyces mirabilis TaxID=574656 RepID=A0AAE1C6A0_9PEZI|nr:hypothetical protein LTR78_000148 [Recurvomyces mirabilis]KAK5161805.1 hypothetical protein LTS14_000150 [Recurvomyces mirabilis]
MDKMEPRVSRYRSQRRAQQQLVEEDETPDVPPIPQDEVEAGDGVVRSRSRYHRKNATNAVNTAVESSPKDESGTGSGRYDSPRRDEGNARSSPAQRYRGKSVHRQQSQESPPARLGATKEVEAQVDADGYGNAPRKLSAYDKELNVRKDESPRKQDTAPQTELFPPPRADPVRPSTKPVVMDGPPSSDKIRATKSTNQLPRFDDEEDEQKGGCFGLFKRKRGEATPGHTEKRPLAPATQDVPKSAVNSGDRRVLVECGKSKTVFPVTIETTPIDIIKSAATVMSERINPRSAVLLEMFGSVGIQRALRRYEHVRDVMNSWDTDRQNSLLLVDPGTGTSEAELSLAGAPKEEPSEQSWLLSVSQKPGKWDKRMITLHPTGQISMQRDPNKPQQTENICHLSDFDIYTPTPEKLRKKIKPPKKHCFAIKSQQKAIMFESTQNFVHFFCTNDARTADEFFRAVQGWRSWYLVNVLGEGGKRVTKAADATQGAAHPGEGKGVARSGSRSHHQRGADSVGSHYQLGSFRPLSMHVGQFDMPVNGTDGTGVEQQGPTKSSAGFNKSANQFDPMVSPERRTSTRKKGQTQLPPVAPGGKVLADDEPLANLARRGSVDKKRTSTDASGRQEEFATTGLLGRSYSQRQRDVAEKDTRRVDAFTAGPNLLNGGLDATREEERSHFRKSLEIEAPQRGKSTRVVAQQNSSGDMRRHKSTRAPNSSNHNELGRSGSVREKVPPKPLVDLTPQYREPLQHTNKGKAFRPDPSGLGGLVANATSPEDFIGAPPASDWRRSPNNVAQNPPQPQSQHQQGGLQPSKSTHRRANSVNKRPETSSRAKSDENAGTAFTGEGLLASSQAQAGWGGGDKGHGVVVDGPRAKAPLVDFQEASRFVPGSLLNRVEAVEGGPGRPVIDREKRVERDVRVGEGY